MKSHSSFEKVKDSADVHHMFRLKILVTVGQPFTLHLKYSSCRASKDRLLLNGGLTHGGLVWGILAQVQARVHSFDMNGLKYILKIF